MKLSRIGNLLMIFTVVFNFSSCLKKDEDDKDKKVVKHYYLDTLGLEMDIRWVHGPSVATKENKVQIIFKEVDGAKTKLEKNQSVRVRFFKSTDSSGMGPSSAFSITKLIDGTYLVEKLKFPKEGEWEMSVSIHENGKAIEKKTFKFKVSQ